MCDAVQQDEEPALASGASTAGLGSRSALNAALVMSARVASRLLALVAVLAANAHLGPDGFGRLQLVVTYTALVSVVADLGFNLLYVREGARHPEQLSRYLGNVITVKTALLLAALGVLAAVLRIPGLDDLLLPGFAVMALIAYSSLLRGTFYATGRLGWEAADIVLESVILLGVFAAGIATGQGVAYFLWGYAASYAFSCVWFAAVIRTRHLARLRPRLDAALLRSWAWTGMPLALTYLMTNVYFKIDGPILAQFRSFQEVGWYSAAYKPFESLLFIPLTVRQVAFPVISVYHHADPRRLRTAVEKLFRALLLVGWPCTVGLLVLTPGIDRLLHLRPESEPALRILALAVVVMFVDNTFIAALNAMDRQAVYARIILLGLAVNLALDFSLIPAFGYLGAASATVATEAALATAGWIALGRAGIRLAVPRLGARILLAGVAMGLLLVPARGSHGWATVGAIAYGSAAYAALVAALRVLDDEERALARRALRRLRRAP